MVYSVHQGLQPATEAHLPPVLASSLWRLVSATYGAAAGLGARSDWLA
jgi:hypothetical protein